MLHGIGIESPTQIAIFIASTSVVSTAEGLGLLAAWVIGLVVANAALAVAAGTGLTRPDGNRKLLQALALAVAGVSIVLGLRYLLV